MCGVFEAGAGGAAGWTADRISASRCRIFRETLIGVSGEPRVTLHHCRPINPRGAQARDTSDPVEDVAGGGTRDRSSRFGSQSAELENSQASLCLPAPG